MVKVVTFFLIGMIILGIFGRLKMPRLPGRRNGGVLVAKCPKCGVLGPAKGTCQCGYKGKR
tara:strand:- start:66 stop:248 length:183 start_codon:yes stop_codon:yes gene_type:complete